MSGGPRGGPSPAPGPGCACPELAGVARTALWTAACRALESERPDARLTDPLSRALLGDEGLAAGEALEAAGGAHDGVVARSRLVDDFVLRALGEGAEVVLSLGAGLDTRPQRLRGPPKTRWIEVDLPEVIRWKEARLGRVGRLERTLGGVEVSRYATDLREVGALAEVIDRETGGRPSVAVLEGVLAYLAPREAHGVLAMLARREGLSRVICDVGGGPWSWLFARRVSAVTARAGAPYRTRIGRPERFFRRAGLRVVRSVSLADWDAASAAPRWSRPWTRFLVPGYRATARVVEVVPANGC